MNFNLFFIITTSFILLSCGVKSNPLPPQGTALPSYIDEHSGKNLDGKEKEKTKQEQKKKE